MLNIDIYNKIVEEKNPKMNSTVSFKGRLSAVEKLKMIKYAEERSIHTASNYYGVSRYTKRYWIKVRRN